MPDSLHAGDLLATRYRLDELLTESRGGRFWRARPRARPARRRTPHRQRGRTSRRAARCRAAYGAAPRPAGCCACSTPTAPTSSATS
ncbi:hypothetical protein [Nocardioides sp. B-3]|uniref:hypothetical protein n=1 Tax=Nocardioides sp. B-3 TaxID=2895565 RepID=UPI002152485C|nr:hypothetical protein [Nocardioides sp. B-3]UUZ61105.1 hypothetical protein LP418_10965 [Nocardioides sp. B-3]